MASRADGRQQCRLSDRKTIRWLEGTQLLLDFKRIADLGLRWWALGRVDTLMQYSDATWDAMARSGLKMIFSGAESGTDAALAQMNKGGKSSAALTLELARRMRSYGIVPEFSFVLGCPPDPRADVETTFDFIRRVKQINPATEIVLYTYTPVPLDGSLYTEARRLGFVFPETLEQWASPEWEQLSMRRGDGIPWMDRSSGNIRRRVRDFERVINAFYPTVTDLRLTGWRRAASSGWRGRSRRRACCVLRRARYWRIRRPTRRRLALHKPSRRCFERARRTERKSPM